MIRREKDGNQNGMKMDKYRNSRFETDQLSNDVPFQSRTQSINTIGGKWAENRGHRATDELDDLHLDNPFENGKVRTWRARQGWDNYFMDRPFRPGRRGGAIIGADETDHSGRGPKGYRRNDERIFEEVCETLFASPDVDASDMEVSVKEGLVFLKGRVDNREMKKLAEAEVENISGVKDVQNFLTIGNAA